MEKKILGLDLGTNSIGWALVTQSKNGIDEDFKPTHITDLGVRIIPMDAAEMSDFDKGKIQSQAAARTAYRGARRLRERHLLRRQRLHRVLNILGFLPVHYAKHISFEKNPGQIKPDTEPKIAYFVDEKTGGFEFYFKQSFNEMVEDFKVHQPELVKEGKKIPYDWVIYYLRKKALTQKISKEELAWLLLHFNQKRGYYQQRGEEEEINEAKEYQVLKVIEVTDSGDKKGNASWYNVLLDNGDIYPKLSQTPLDWVGITLEFIVTTKENPKTGEIKRSYSIPKEGDWTLLKKKTEKDIDRSEKTVGCYIYETLLENPNQKIKGKLIQTIERRFYRKELNSILATQIGFHPELRDQKLYETSITELYKSNEAYRESIKKKDFRYLLADDILFYHRPLKSKKSLIEDCQYEYRAYKNEKTGESDKKYLKCISKSHPLFQELRVWQFINNVRITKKEDGADVTSIYLPTMDSYVALFNKLKERENVKQNTFLSSIVGAKLKEAEFGWNYGERTLPMCPTHWNIANCLTKLKDVDKSFLTTAVEEHLWHILYSVNEPEELKQALRTFATKNKIEDIEGFASEFVKIKPFDKDYSSYSLKATKKLLSLVRMGKYWDETTIDDHTRVRINKIIDGEHCNQIKDIVREKVKKELGEQLAISAFSGLPLWLACYVIYDRHSEASETGKWESAAAIDKFLKEFKQHSLRNPVVEKVVTETLRVVRDIWAKHGDFEEIHIELGRNMKSSKEQRAETTSQIQKNEETNERIRLLLSELQREGLNARPGSYAQHDKLKIYEEGVFGLNLEIPEYIQSIIKKPSASEMLRYKCWLDQKYISPYTGKAIALSKLFTAECDIEHILPQARYYDDSFSNKIICERAVNGDKGNMLASEYIRTSEGKTVNLGNGKSVSILSYDDYEALVKRNFRNSPVKMKKLLMDEIPDDFIDRQMNDTRYISKYIKGLLSNIVREEGEAEATSKNVISVTGMITSRLKEDWGLNDVWNKLVTPRFERLNELTNSTDYGYMVDNRFKTQVPENLMKGFTKKRIDHRHHAVDALVVACATRSHVNYLNNMSAKSDKYYMRTILRDKLCAKNKHDKWVFNKPYDTFTQDSQKAIDNIFISFKQNLRVINKSTNYSQRFEDGKKVFVKQTKGDNWAIRKPLHKETVSGRVNLQSRKTVALSVALDNWQKIVDRDIRTKIKQLFGEQFDNKQVLAYFKKLNNRYAQKDVSKLEVYYYSDEAIPLVASRKVLNSKFTEKNIKSVTDTNIQQILLKHLNNYRGNTEEAFSAEGVETMNKHIQLLNNGKFHKPIYKVRVFETLGNKFNVGQVGNKKDKYVEAAQGTNLFFAVYQSAEGKRSFDTIPLHMAIERLKQGERVSPELNEKGDKLQFTLSPNDLVYVPTEDQMEHRIDVEDVEKNKGRVYKFMSCTDKEGHFIPYYIASPIIQTTELGSNNKSQRAWTTGEMIKEICVKIEIDRLGHIVNVKT